MFDNYLSEKLKILLDSFCRAFDLVMVVTFEAYLKTDDRTCPCDVNSFVIRCWW